MASHLATLSRAVSSTRVLMWEPTWEDVQPAQHLRWGFGSAFEAEYGAFLFSFLCKRQESVWDQKKQQCNVLYVASHILMLVFTVGSWKEREREGGGETVHLNGRR
jgi:hypothetical protein